MGCIASNMKEDGVGSEVVFALDGNSGTDVFFIHDRFGHFMQSWSSNCKDMWIKSLPLTLKDCSIVTYGYHTPSLFSSYVELSLAGEARQLIEHMVMFWLCGSEERKLVFVCHGLGSAIVKKAILLCADNLSKIPQWDSFIQRVKGVVFLGKDDTMQPHKNMKESIQTCSTEFIRMNSQQESIIGKMKVVQFNEATYKSSGQALTGIHSISVDVKDSYKSLAASPCEETKALLVRSIQYITDSAQSPFLTDTDFISDCTKSPLTPDTSVTSSAASSAEGNPPQLLCNELVNDEMLVVSVTLL